jgi:UDP:flavonoid glycosyltransferase YjiC (YdhE family)
MQDFEAGVVLIAPLDWGLGHATRCIPIIYEFLTQGAQVMIAASGSQKILLKKEFPDLEFVDIPTYQIRYKRGVFLKWNLFFKSPVFLRRIKQERQWLNSLLEKRRIDLVISDNRYGLYHQHTINVFITHQLYIQSGINLAANKILWQWNNRLLKNFSLCWVPDQKNDNSVAGKLAHPTQKPKIPVEYIGLLSRFKKFEKSIVKDSLLILISGPEPQRTDFEKIILEQLPRAERRVVVIRGLPAEKLPIPSFRENIIIYNHLDTESLNELINISNFIIARGGYSTIMDLIQLERNAIIIPTPGQPEQEYLASYLHAKSWMYVVRQKDFRIEMSLNSYQQAKLIRPIADRSLLPEAVATLLAGFKNNNTTP